MIRLDIPISNGAKLVVIFGDGTYGVRLVWTIDKRPTFATPRIPITEKELRSLIDSDCAHVDLDILRLAADPSRLTLYYKRVFFGVEHEVWKPMMTEWLDSINTLNVE